MQTSAVAAVEQAIRDDVAFVDAGFRVMSVSPPETPDGALLPLRVGTLYGEHLAYAIVDDSVGGSIAVGMVLRATGWPEAFEAGPGLLLEVEGLVPPEEYTLEMCPVRGLPVVGAQSLLRISELLDSEIKNPLVKQAVHALLANPKIFTPFFTVPAAQKAHHACPGGLALHSLEAAQIVAAMPRECFGESISRDLAIVGALLHDLGKIQQYQPGGGYRHGSISHETRTIALAQGMLDWLTEKEDQSVSEQLMYLLSADGKREHADCPEVAAIVMADRLSATADATASAFRFEKPHYKFAMKDWGGAKPKRYVRAVERYRRPYQPSKGIESVNSSVVSISSNRSNTKLNNINTNSINNKPTDSTDNKEIN